MALNSMTAKYHIAALLLSSLCLTACSERKPDAGPASPRESTPYTVDMKQSGAMLTRYYVLVYFVASSNNLIQVSIPVPGADQAMTRVDVGGQSKTSATLSTGPNVVKYVIPSGASPAPPINQKAYSHRGAAGGFITYSCTAWKGTLPPESTVVLSADQLDFGDGNLYSIAEHTFTAFSPPP